MASGEIQTSGESGVSAFLRVVRRRWIVLLACFIAVTGSALAVSLLQENKYSATASLLFRESDFDEQLFGFSKLVTEDPQREAATNVRLVSLDVVADRTAAELDAGLTGEEVSDRLSIEPEGQSDVVSITATDPDPDFAAELANTFASSYIEFRRFSDREQVARARELLTDQLNAFSPAERAGREGRLVERSIVDLETLEAVQTGDVEFVQPAEVPDDPSSPNLVANVVLGAFVGILLGLAAAFVLERVDRRLRQSDDLEAAFQLPVLGAVPDSRALEASGNAVPDLPFAEAEAFRLLRTRLRYFNVDKDVHSVLVTSPSPAEGKSTVSWNLARTAAEAGSRAVLVEADFHQPTLAARQGLDPIPGLAEVVSRQVPLDRAIQHIQVAARGNGTGDDRQLDAIVAGATAPNPAELMESTEMARLIDELESEYDLVVFDTPPVSVLADAIPLMKLVSGVIVVGQLGKTTRDDAVDLREQLRNLEAPVLGVVANRARKRGRGYGYYYGAPAAREAQAQAGQGE